ncbi:MAG: hypothetical protein J6A23_10120 [Thermoguttaceae bacterium]|nr:hypothetical protein [Thermoguttaceae bacterium]
MHRFHPSIENKNPASEQDKKTCAKAVGNPLPETISTAILYYFRGIRKDSLREISGKNALRQKKFSYVLDFSMDRAIIKLEEDAYGAKIAKKSHEKVRKKADFRASADVGRRVSVPFFIAGR